LIAVDRQRGLLLTLVTALMWGLLPVALKQVLTVMEAWTLTWFRFLVAALLIGAWLTVRGKTFVPVSLQRVPPRIWAVLLLCGLGLVSNYVLYLVGLDHISPATAQLVIQLGPLLLAFSAAVLFRERVSSRQLVGVLFLSVGFLLFFKERLGELLTPGSGLASGVLLIVAAAVTWVVYALSQRVLQDYFDTLKVLFFICALGTVTVWPWAEPRELFELKTVAAWSLFIFCCINTIIAYGAFAESLKFWEASRASAVLALTPVITMVTMLLAGILLPWWPHEEKVDGFVLIGGAIVVGGSVLVALGKPKSF
jgi:drug/metabolite transporter (DMT)-like permease